MVYIGEHKGTTNSAEKTYKSCVDRFFVGFRELNAPEQLRLIASVTRCPNLQDSYDVERLNFSKILASAGHRLETTNIAMWRRRLTPRKRPDARRFYGFWMAEDFENYDDFDLLGLTQGLSPTDSYEFLAVYKYAPDFRFVTDVFRPAESDAERRAAWTRAQEGDELTFEVKKDGSPVAQDAVEVFCQKESIGFIKPGHCNYFFEAKKQDVIPYLRAKRKIDFGPRQALFIEVGTASE